MSYKQRLTLQQSAQYRIEVEGSIQAPCAHMFFTDFEVTYHESANGRCTILQGQVVDQSALHGVIARIRDLGLPLRSIQLLSH